jgi:hypothetical protein
LIGSVGGSDGTKFLVPIAWSSQVDDNGAERIHVTHYSTQSTVTSISGLYVYELDKGWGFAGNFIPASYTINWFYKDPFSFTTAKKIRLDGLTSGISSCSVTTSKDYSTEFSTNSVDISLPKNPLSSFYPIQTPSTNIANIQVNGRSLSFKVSDTLSGEIGPLPPDTHQIMLVHFDTGGKLDA